MADTILIVAIVVLALGLIRMASGMSRRKREALQAKQDAERQRIESLNQLLADIADDPAAYSARNLAENDMPSVKLMKSEQPAWILPDVTYYKTKTTTRYVGGSRGMSFRVAKGVSVRTSGFRGERVSEESLERADTGTAVLTTKHLYFAGDTRHRFRVRLDKMVWITSHADAIEWMRDNLTAKPEFLEHPEAAVLHAMIEALDELLKAS